jgi:hypothetical protein
MLDHTLSTGLDQTIFIFYAIFNPVSELVCAPLACVSARAPPQPLSVMFTNSSFRAQRGFGNRNLDSRKS